MPPPRKELQQLPGTLGHWRKHVPGFSIIACQLYLLLQKGKPWKCNAGHEEAIKTLTQELKTYQSPGSIRLHNPITAERGFAECGIYCNLFQTGTEGPKRPLFFSSTAVRDRTEILGTEKRILSLV